MVASYGLSVPRMFLHKVCIEKYIIELLLLLMFEMGKIFFMCWRMFLFTFHCFMIQKFTESLKILVRANIN